MSQDAGCTCVRTQGVNVSSLATRSIANEPHPEEAALFLRGRLEGWIRAQTRPSFETHRLSDAPQDEADGWSCRRNTPRRSEAKPREPARERHQHHLAVPAPGHVGLRRPTRGTVAGTVCGRRRHHDRSCRCGYPERRTRLHDDILGLAVPGPPIPTRMATRGRGRQLVLRAAAPSGRLAVSRAFPLFR